MTPITAKAGDAIRIDKQLTEGSGRDGTPVDLTGETVRVYVQYDDNALVANQEVEYVDRPNGKIAVELQPSQTSNIGRHSIEWVVDPQGDPTTYPADDYDTLRTQSPLDRELTPSEDTPPDLTVTTLTVEGDVVLNGGDLTGVGTLESDAVNTVTSLTDPAGVTHTGELADIGDTGGSITVEDDGTTVLSDVSGVNFGTDASVTDDGDGTVTVDVSGGSGTDTRIDVSDDGTLVLSEPTDINFGSNLNVTADGDGTVTVTGDATSTDTRTDVSEATTTVVSDTEDINFEAVGAASVTVTDDTDGTATVKIDATNTDTDTRTDVSESGTTVTTETTDINFTESGSASVTVSDDGDGSATIDVSATDTDTTADISEDGTQVVSDVQDINFVESNAATVTVNDDGDGSVTVDIAATDTNTDTHADIEDNGTLAVGDVSSINFGNNVTVTDDGDGSVTVDAASSTDTRINVSSGGSLVVSEPSDVNFASNLAVTDDGDGSVTVDLADSVTITSVTGASGTTVFDDATQTVGDGTTSADHASVNTENLNNTYYAEPNDGVNSIASSLSAGEELVVIGDHTITTPIQPPDHTTLTIRGSVTLADGADDYIIDAENGTGVTIQGPGAVDGNKNNVSRFSQPAGVWIVNSSDVTVRNLEVRNVVGGAAINAGTGALRPEIKDNYIHDCGLSDSLCDAIFQWATDSQITGNRIRNVTDAFIASDQCKRTVVAGNIGFNTDSYNTNVDSPNGAYACYANLEDWSGVIANNIAQNVPSYGISDVADNGYRVEAIIADNKFVDIDQGVYMRNADLDVSITGNHIENASDTGIRAKAQCHISDNTIVSSSVPIWLQDNASGSKVEGNKIPSVSSQIGILVEVSGCDIVNNTVRGSPSSGIQIQVSASDMTICGNRVTDSAFYGIRATNGIDDSIITENFVKNNGQYGIRASGVRVIAKNNRALNNSPDFDFSGLTNSIEKDNLSGT